MPNRPGQGLKSFSSIACFRYTLAKKLPGLDFQWCKSPEVGLPAPDIVFYMRVSPEAAAGRGGYGEERYEKAEFQRQVSVALVTSIFDQCHNPELPYFKLAFKGKSLPTSTPSKAATGWSSTQTNRSTSSTVK